MDNQRRYTIDLQETDTEYHLYIPASQKERAKSIDGRRWDTEKRAWVYPRTARIFDALISEFGEDLIQLSVTRPEVPINKKGSVDLVTENKELREQFGKIQETLQLLTKSTNDEDESHDLQKALVSAKKELVEARNLACVHEEQLNKLQRELQAAREEITALKTSAAWGDSEQYFQKKVKEKAKQATGNDRDFMRIVDKLSITDSLPLEIAKEIENALRRVLRTDDRSLNFNDLLSLSKDAQLLPDEAFHLAHIIRRQRNILAHEQVDTRTHIGRVLLVLFAASVLWPHLPE